MKYRVYQRPNSSRWQMEIRINGEIVLRQSTGVDDHATALEIAVKTGTELKLRSEMGLDLTGKTINAVYLELIKTLPENKRDYYNISWRNHIAPVFDGRRLNSIKSTEITRFIKTLPVGNSRKAATGVVLRQVFKYAQEMGYIQPSNAPYVPPIRYRSGVREAFTEDEMRQLLVFLKNDWRDAVKKTDRDSRRLLYYYVNLLYYSGARPGVELEKLEFWCVNEETSGNKPYLRVRILADNTKVRKEREMVVGGEFIPLYSELVKLQQGWGNYSANGRLFADSRGIVRRFSNQIFRRALIRSGLLVGAAGKERSLYSIRHRRITQWVRDIGNLPAIATQCGTSPGMITQVYNKSVPRDFVDKFIA